MALIVTQAYAVTALGGPTTRGGRDMRLRSGGRVSYALISAGATWIFSRTRSRCARVLLLWGVAGCDMSKVR